jgi:hypothetical protein
MNTQTALQTVRPQAGAALIPGTPNPRAPAIPERAAAATKAARLDPQAKPDDSAQFRAEMLRRAEAPFPPAWGHGGLND